MRGQFRRLHFYQIGFYVLDDAVADASRQKVHNGRMNFRRSGKRPAFGAVVTDDLADLIGQLFMNASIGFAFQFALRDRSGVMLPANAVTDRKTAGDVGEFIG